MKIKNYITPNGLIANYLKLETSFEYKSEYFTIVLTFMNDGQIIYSMIENVTPEVVREWFEIAKREPEKATFLNFSIIAEWVCNLYGIEIEENT
jgi:hypothetical protein